MTSTTGTHLSDRALGWLRFLWDKTTTPDDWSDQGEPHPWWDRNGSPPMCAFPRWDLAEMAYALPIMMESTPAWREPYVRIADGLLWRYVAFWGSVDWLTLIGPDPNTDRYPPEWMCCVPESLRGTSYPMVAWTGNGIEPWGLQPDPVGADGNLFYKVWLNLTLDIRRYVSGEATEHDSFDVSGYLNRPFPWTHSRVAHLLSHQLGDRPQGPHCENTKIFPFCVAAAGLSLQLYDQLLGTDLHAPFPRWVEFAKQHYMGLKPNGDLDWFALYYDPITQTVGGMHEPHNAAVWLPLLYPQDREWGTQLYELSMRAIGFSDPQHPIVQIASDPRHVVTALAMAREVGDNHTEKRLREIVENEYEPRFFGEENDRFGYWFGIDEPWPKGTLNAMMMLSDAGAPGAWTRVFTDPLTSVHTEPTVRGVDYPTLGISRARNDMAARVMDISTTAATPSRRGAPTTFTIDRLPNPDAVTMTLDDQEYPRWRVTGPDSIEVDLTVDTHDLRLNF